MSDARLEPAHWHRLHPLSPIVRAGRATIGIAIVLVPSVLTGRRSSGLVYELAFVGVLLGLGFVSWLVTRWRVEDDDLRIETGLIRRQSLRFPLAQVQAIDIVKPGLARVFRVAELRLRMAGNTVARPGLPICRSAMRSPCGSGFSSSRMAPPSRSRLPRNGNRRSTATSACSRRCRPAGSPRPSCSATSASPRPRSSQG